MPSFYLNSFYFKEEEVPAPAATLKPVDDDDIFAASAVPPVNLDEEDDLFKSAAPPPVKVEDEKDDLFTSATPPPAKVEDKKDDLFTPTAASSTPPVAAVEKEIDLEDDDDDDIFKSARLEPEPAKVKDVKNWAILNILCCLT